MTLGLVAGDFVQDGEISIAVFNVELVSDLFQKCHLVLSQLFVGRHVIHLNDGPVLLDTRFDKQGVELVGVSLPCLLAQIIDLILLEAGDEGALMLVQDKLRDELAHSLHVDQLNDVNLVSQFLAGFLMPV